MDLDQALHIERNGNGYRVRYAIAHLASLHRTGGAIDAEARRRGQTIYSPDERVPLHPPALSEGRRACSPRSGATGMRVGHAGGQDRRGARPGAGVCRAGA